MQTILNAETRNTDSYKFTHLLACFLLQRYQTCHFIFPVNKIVLLLFAS